MKRKHRTYLHDSEIAAQGIFKLFQVAIIIALLVFLVAFTSYAGSSDSASEWTKTDIGLEIAWQALHVIDWRQTMDIAQHPYQFHEAWCHFLGQHPSSGAVNRYMVFTAVLHPVVTHILPRPWRTFWQGITILDTGSSIMSNRKIGIGMQFKF